MYMSIPNISNTNSSSSLATSSSSSSPSPTSSSSAPSSSSNNTNNDNNMSHGELLINYFQPHPTDFYPPSLSNPSSSLFSMPLQQQLFSREHIPSSVSPTTLFKHPDSFIINNNSSHTSLSQQLAQLDTPPQLDNIKQETTLARHDPQQFKEEREGREGKGLEAKESSEDENKEDDSSGESEEGDVDEDSIMSNNNTNSSIMSNNNNNSSRPSFSSFNSPLTSSSPSHSLSTSTTINNINIINTNPSVSPSVSPSPLLQQMPLFQSNPITTTTPMPSTFSSSSTLLSPSHQWPLTPSADDHQWQQVCVLFRSFLFHPFFYCIPPSKDTPNHPS